MLRRNVAVLAACLGALLVLAAVPAVVQAQEATGRIAGTILDEYNGMTLPTAPVTVVGTDATVFADLDGIYALTIPPGTYEIRVAFPGYQDRIIRDVVVTAGRTTELDIIMFLETLQYSEEVIVRVDVPEANTDAAAVLERSRSGNIEDNISGARMRQNADSDAAQAAERVPGLSVVDNSYVFVRGLGARYSNSTLNGVQMPTTEPDKRVVPLDLFPSAMIDQIQVIKTYTPDKPGEFSGGLVEIESLSFPQDAAFGVGAQFGTDNQLGDPGLMHAGGGGDWAGFDDGVRALASTRVPSDRRVVRGGIFTPELGFTRADLVDIAASFNDEWSPLEGNPGINQGYQAYFGDSWEKFSIVGSYSYKNDFDNRTEEQNVYRVAEGDLSVRNNYDFHTTTTTAKQALVGNLQFRPTSANRFMWENFWTHKGDKETRFFEGFNDDIGTDIRNNRLRWIEEDILTSKVSGSHLMQGLGSSRLNWHVAYSRASRDEPDLRETLYENNNGTFVLSDESQSGFRLFIDQTDRIWDGGFDWSFFFSQWGSLPSSMQFGVQANLRERDFEARRFRNRHLFTRNVDLSLPAERLFVRQNYEIGAFELREETRNTDAYTGEHDVYAGYFMFDLPLSQQWRFVGGARYEKSDQMVDTFDPFVVGAADTALQTENRDADILPSVNLVYQLRIDQNFRVGYSRTLNRPQFRELAPFEFTDVVGGRSIIGNPDLITAHIDNFDARWEWFPGSTEIIAASFFWKNFSDPIERIVEPTSQLRTSFTNAESARNTGVEFEFQKIIGAHFEGGANYTYVDSQVTVGRAAGQVQTSTDRPLAGTSQNLLNGYFEWHMPNRALALRFLASWFDDRILDVGALGLPDIIENSREKIDLVFVWSAANQLAAFPRLNVRVAIENLSNPEYSFTQSDRMYRSFTVGRAFSASVGWDILR